MPDDKRPRPTIDMKAEPANQNAQRPELPPPAGMSAGRRRVGFAAPYGKPGSVFSHLLAGLLGGLIVGGGGYLALTSEIPGIALTDANTRHELKRLEERTSDLDHMVRSQARPTAANVLSPTGPGVEVINELRARLDGMVQAAHALDESVQAISARLQELEQRNGTGSDKSAAQAEAAQQIAPLAARLATLEREIESLSKTQSERQVDARSAALTLALTNLKRAIGEGRPFSAELAAVENLSTVKLPIVQLTPFKDSGIATLSDLKGEFETVSKKAIEKYYQSNGSSFVGKVFSRAKAAIQVRPSDSSGNSVEAVIGRMDTALRSGNLKEALAEATSLQGPALTEMRPWLEQAQARLAADEALKKTDQELLAALIRPASKRQ